MSWYLSSFLKNIPQNDHATPSYVRMRRIEDLTTYLSENPGDHGLYTGTFDPSHIRHVYLAHIGVRHCLRKQIPNPLLLLPHSFNESKFDQAAPLEKRRNWLVHNISHFAPELLDHVVLCEDASIPGMEPWWEVQRKFNERIIRIIGADVLERDMKLLEKTRLLVVERSGTSSTNIKAAIREGKFDSLIGIMAPSVLQDIQETGVYL